MHDPYVWSLFLCLVEFLCAQVSCKIRNPRTQGNYRIMHLVWLFWMSCYLADFWLIINLPLKGHVSYFSHAVSIIISLPCCQVHIQSILLLGTEVRSSLIFERICIGKVDLFVDVSDGAGLDHYGDERYFQSFYWQYFQSGLNNVLLSCINLLFIGFQILLQLWIEMYCIAGVSVACIQIVLALVKM